MKKIITAILSVGFISFFSSCTKQLDLAPVSTISNSNYWNSASSFDAFVTGIHTQFRADNGNFLALGELRADIFGTDPGNSGAFTGEATQGVERTWLNTLNLDNVWTLGNFGGFYYNIVQINLLISQLHNTNLLTPATKSYYLGIAFGMRAYYYFQLYRSWGGVILQTDPVTSFNIATLAKPSNTAEETIALIKSDIDSSNNNFGNNYAFNATNGKYFWSKSATQMLKANVYLWTSYRGGGAADATTALNALNDIQTNVPGLALVTTAGSAQSAFANVFATTNRQNSEIIFASHYGYNEATMGFATSTFLPQTGLISNFYDSVNNMQFNPNSTGNWGGLLRAPVKIATFRQFNPKDTRALASIQPAYNLVNGQYIIAGCFVDKYQGEFQAGNRVITNDLPIYRYAGLLLLKAEAEVILGMNPANEIDQVRARAYGSNYSDAVYGYPNQPIDVDPKEAILQERFYEFIFEGKRWYDLLRMDPAGSYVYEHVLPASAFPNTDPVGRLLWPIDRTSLTNNRDLVQTAGYSSF
ncbi:MAG TPA: SusD family outer membrane lipoprotein NanU [Hanamia sp.]|nr:SusD family outer membrane lipoprotein NanU [Hanamia sp.]